MEKWYDELVKTSSEIVDNHIPDENEAMVVFATTPNGNGDSDIHTSIMGEALSVVAVICACVEDNPALCAVIGATYEYLVSEGKLSPREIKTR